MIGDPPNIIIGSFANLTFGAFVTHLTVVIVICVAATSGYFLYYYRREYAQASVPDMTTAMDQLRRSYRITDVRLLTVCFILLGGTVLLFICHGFLGMKPSVAALMGATVLSAVSRVDPATRLTEEIDRPTLIFFMGLFMVIAGAEETWLIHLISQEVLHFSQGNLTLAALLVLWVSALLPALMDNFPFTVTMLPIITCLTNTLSGAESGVLRWALALGAV